MNDKITVARPTMSDWKRELKKEEKRKERDEFRWKIKGRVEDISMNFTTIVEDEGS